jgi:hypothetical protein
MYEAEDERSLEEGGCGVGRREKSGVGSEETKSVNV